MTKKYYPPIKLQRAIRQAKPAPNEPINGWLGDLDGLVLVDGKPNYLYVTLKNGQTVEAYNENMPPVPLLPVEIEVDSRDRARFRIIGPRASFDGDTPYPLIKVHKESHTYPSYDAVPIHLRQFLPGLVMPGGGLTIDAQPDWHKAPTGWVYSIGVKGLSLAAHVPASGARFVLVTTNTTGGVSLTPGSIQPFADLNATFIPNLPTGHKYRAAVRLLAGQTVIVDRETNGDIYDLRGGVGGNGTWGDIAGSLENQADLWAALEAKPDLADLDDVAVSGSYNDLVDQPLIVSEDLTVQIDGVTDDFSLLTAFEIGHVFFNGQRLYEDQYSLAGTILTLTFVPLVGDSLVVVGTIYANRSVLVPDVDVDGVPKLRLDQEWVDYPDAEETGLNYVRRPGAWREAPAHALRIVSTPTAAYSTIAVNSTVYMAPPNLVFTMDIRAFRQVRIALEGTATQGGETISVQLAPLATPATPCTAPVGDLIVVTNPNIPSLMLSDWFALADPELYDSNAKFCIALKGSNTTVDLMHNFIEVHFR